MNATSTKRHVARALGLLLGSALSFALVSCLLTAPPPQPAPGPQPVAQDTAPAPVSSTPAPRPLPRTSGTVAQPLPPRPDFSRPPPASAGTISPSSAQVGAQVAIFANLEVAARSPQEVQCWFEGAGVVAPVSVRADRLVVQVPAGARTGNLRVTFRRRVLWSGGFTVLASIPPPPLPTTTVDCQNPPSMMCCKAMTEACMSCARKAEEARAAWDAQCRVEQPPKPAPINCSQPPPRRGCCKALTPECTECQERAAEENRRWDEACMRR